MDTDRHRSLNLPVGCREGPADPLDVLARIAKESIQSAVHTQSDVTAVLEMRPDGWWLGMLPA